MAACGAAYTVGGAGIVVHAAAAERKRPGAGGAGDADVERGAGAADAVVYGAVVGAADVGEVAAAAVDEAVAVVFDAAAAAAAAAVAAAVAVVVVVAAAVVAVAVVDAAAGIAGGTGAGSIADIDAAAAAAVDAHDTRFVDEGYDLDAPWTCLVVVDGGGQVCVRGPEGSYPSTALTDSCRGLVVLVGSCRPPGAPADSCLAPGAPVDKFREPGAPVDRCREPGALVDRCRAPDAPVGIQTPVAPVDRCRAPGVPVGIPAPGAPVGNYWASVDDPARAECGPESTAGDASAALGGGREDPGDRGEVGRSNGVGDGDHECAAEGGNRAVREQRLRACHCQCRCHFRTLSPLPRVRMHDNAPLEEQC